MKVVNLISKTFFTLTIYIIPSVEKNNEFIFNSRVQEVEKYWRREEFEGLKKSRDKELYIGQKNEESS